MTHAFCTECGSFVPAAPKGAGFRALSPVTFCIETKLEENKEDGEEDPSSSAVLRSSMCGVSCLLPAELLPTQHVNYENRLRDYHDDLPKWRTFAHRTVRLTMLGHSDAGAAWRGGRGEAGAGARTGAGGRERSR